MDFVLAVLPWTFLWRLLLKRRELSGILLAMSMGAVYVTTFHPALIPTSQTLSRAGVVAIIKCLQLPQLDSGDSCKSKEPCLRRMQRANHRRT